MKKFGLLVAGVSMVAGLTAATADPVYSKNVVGYQNLTIVPGLNMIGNNWNAVGGTGQTAIQDILDTTGLVAGDEFFNSDNINLWDPTLNGGLGGYKQYYFGDFGGVFGEEYDRKWYELGNDEEPTTDVIVRGQGFWLNHRGTGALAAMVGEVPNDASKSHTFTIGLTQFASAYTAEMELNGANMAWTAKGGDEFFNSDNINVWDPSLNAGQGGYVQFYFGDFAGAFGEEYDNKWYELGNDEEPTTAVITMGAGAWYRARGASDSSLVESKPYSL